MSNATATKLAPVAALSPLAPYVGGKRALASRIVARLSGIPHTLYAEPFVGMGGIFFRRQSRPSAEVINDWSEDIANLFRILQRHPNALLAEIKWRLPSRADFARLKATDPATLTDLERAARFLFLQRSGFGGKVCDRTFGVDYERGPRFNARTLAPLLAAVHRRLAGVTIECLPYADFLTRYDRSGSLFYLDPPYFGTEHYYGKTLFTPADHAKLAGLLATLKSPWILSINAAPEIRALYTGCRIEEVSLHYGAGGGARPAREFLITPAK